MEKIILTSSFYDVADELKQEFLDESIAEPRVAFFSTGAMVEKVNFYVKKAKKWFVENGFIVTEIDVQNISQEDLNDILENCNIIYVSGGNSFYLLQEFKKKGLDNLIIQYIKLGKIYIGESAGSIILSPNIEYIMKMDDVSVAETLENYESLSAIDFYVVPHFNNMPFKSVVKKIINDYDNKLNLIPISNNQAIFIKDKEQKIITVEK